MSTREKPQEQAPLLARFEHEPKNAADVRREASKDRELKTEN
jgi:hypothetical protein